MVDKPAPAADVQPHVIAFRRDAVDVAGGDAHKPAEVRRPKLLQVWGKHGPRRRPGLPPLEIIPSPLERYLKARRLDRLHQIIDGLDFEGRDGELIESGHEDDRG